MALLKVIKRSHHLTEDSDSSITYESSPVTAMKTEGQQYNAPAFATSARRTFPTDARSPCTRRRNGELCFERHVGQLSAYRYWLATRSYCASSVRHWGQRRRWPPSPELEGVRGAVCGVFWADSVEERLHGMRCHGFPSNCCLVSGRCDRSEP
jgi:hypothetical protein